MAVSLVIVILGLLIFGLFPVGVPLLIYYLVYQHVINKRVREGVTDKKPLPSPLTFGACLVGIYAVIVIALLIPFSFVKQTGVSEVQENEMTTWALYTDEDEGFNELYSIEENPGFNKTVQTQGYFTVTFFEAQDKSTSLHPLYLAYITYSGDAEMIGVTVSDSAQSFLEHQTGTFQGTGEASSQPLLLMRNMENYSAGMKGEAVITVCTLREEEAGTFPGADAVPGAETFTFTLH